MAVKIQLEKDGYVKDGFVGFSYTTYFFTPFVPIFRGDLKGFFILLGARALPEIFIYSTFTFTSIMSSISDRYFFELLEKDILEFMKSIFIIMFIYFIILEVISGIVGLWYNKAYTKKLLNDGYYPMKDDEYSKFILKSYGYLEFTAEDETKLEEYGEVYRKIKKKEKIKFVFCVLHFFLIFGFLFFAFLIMIMAFRNLG